MSTRHPQTCPACRGALLAQELEGHPTHVCESCGGVWLQAGALEAIAVREGRRHGAALSALRSGAEEPSTHSGVTYRPCSVCASLMARRRFSRGARLVVDVCHAHGVWLDPGELERIRELARSGAAPDRLTGGPSTTAELPRSLPTARPPASANRPRRGTDARSMFFSEFAAQLALELFT